MWACFPESKNDMFTKPTDGLQGSEFEYCDNLFCGDACVQNPPMQKSRFEVSESGSWKEYTETSQNEDSSGLFACTYDVAL